MKNMKSLVIKWKEEKQNLQEAISAWRNMARVDGITPGILRSAPKTAIGIKRAGSAASAGEN